MISEAHPATQAHVEVRGLSKHFGGAIALRDVSLAVRQGAIHGLVGENGAGKSTLARIMAGLIRPDAGEICIHGTPATLRSPRDALRLGLTTITQEGSLVESRSVIDNVFLGDERTAFGFLARSRLRRRYAEVSDTTGFEIESDLRVKDLRLADKQRVEVLRAVARDARFLVFDEPTAALNEAESAQLLSVIRNLRDAGRTIVYVSHFLEEVLDLCDEVTILREGAVVRTAAAQNEAPRSLIDSMLGRSLDVLFPERRPLKASAPVALDVRQLGRGGAFKDVTFHVRQGEIVGLAGLAGSGRSELVRAIFGADRPDTGDVYVHGRRLRIRTPRDAIKAGLVLIPEDRKDQGLLMRRSLRENLSLPFLSDVSRAGALDRRAERRRTRDLADRLSVRGGSLESPVHHLSGGNQQKAVFGKWLFREPRVLIADEPTRGIDVGSRLSIYEMCTDAAARGLAVVLVSSELLELLGLAHRILVMRTGSIVAEFEGEISEATVMHAAFGAHDLAGALA
jgi:ABC-type sugar transport system ATPase subunit